MLSDVENPKFLIMFWISIGEQCKGLIDYLLFYVPLNNISLTITGEGMQN
jgi:hypothetical protein